MCKPTRLKEETSTNTTPTNTCFTQNLQTAHENLRKGTLYACLSLILLISAFSITMPHLQSRRDELQCDTLCQGSMTSVRSALALLGSAFMGRLSDTNLSSKTLGDVNGRRVCLYIGTIASLLGLIVNGTMNSITGMWLGMIPSALFQQNFSVYKAMLADYHQDIAQLKEQLQEQESNANKGEGVENSNLSDKKEISDAAARASSVGQLGMSAGIAFMIGPLLGAVLVKTYQGAVTVASCLTILSTVWIVQMPTSSSKSLSHMKDVDSKKKKDDDYDKESDNHNHKPNILSSWKQKAIQTINVQSATSKPALFLISIRLSMALAFHIFNTIWTVSLKRRFDFGPSDHGKFMSFIGLMYAFSQGFVAKRILAPFGSGKGRVNVILASCFLLGIGRVVAFTVSDLRIVYITFGCIITALGVVNTVLTADTCLIAPSNEIGAVYGVLEAAQSGAGMMGPFVGGLLARLDPIVAPLAAVVGLYGVVFLLVLVGYERLILNCKDGKSVESGISGSSEDGSVLKSKKGTELF